MCHALKILHFVLLLHTVNALSKSNPPWSWNCFCCALSRFCRTFSLLVHKARHVLFSNQRVFRLEVWLLPSLISVHLIYCSCHSFSNSLLLSVASGIFAGSSAHQLVHHRHRSKKLLNYYLMKLKSKKIPSGACQQTPPSPLEACAFRTC